MFHSSPFGDLMSIELQGVDDIYLLKSLAPKLSFSVDDNNHGGFHYEVLYLSSIVLSEFIYRGCKEGCSNRGWEGN